MNTVTLLNNGDVLEGPHYHEDYASVINRDLYETRYRHELEREAQTPGMRLVLFHGRETIDQQMTDWGFNGPTLEGILYVKVVYNDHVCVRFNSPKNAQRAQEETGWKWWDMMVLEMPIVNGLVETKTGFFGDWEFQV